MTKAQLLVIGSVPSRLYGLVRHEYQKVHQSSLSTFRVDLDRVCKELEPIKGPFPKKFTLAEIRSVYPDFDPAGIVAIAAQDHDYLESFLYSFWDKKVVGTRSLPYYELSELSPGDNVLVGKGFKREELGVAQMR